MGEVRPLVLNSARVVEASLKPWGLTLGMRAVLEVLAEHGPATVPSVGERLDLARMVRDRTTDELAAVAKVLRPLNRDVRQRAVHLHQARGDTNDR